MKAFCYNQELIFPFEEGGVIKTISTFVYLIKTKKCDGIKYINITLTKKRHSQCKLTPTLNFTCNVLFLDILNF